MASSEQLKALIKSHADKDDSRFYSVAMQVAAQAARQGRGKLAKDLRDLIDFVKNQSEQEILRKKTVHISSPRGEIENLLSVQIPSTKLSDIVLTDNIKLKLERILLEYNQQHKLKDFGLHPKKKILFVGNPGTGKTMTASALAGELHLPLCTIQLHVLITKFMGETAAKLSQIFDHISKTRAVYFFDEFDAIGTDRKSKNDVGEIRRVLNSFLQFLEQIESSGSLVLAATNNPKLLDSALFRRFDDIINFEMPSLDLAGQAMKNRLTLIGTKSIDWSKVCNSTKGLSYAEITKACDEASKDVILSGAKEVKTEKLIQRIAERQAMKPKI